MKIFLINLASAKDRNRQMTARLKRSGLSFELFEAVNGRSFPDEEASKYFDMDFYHNRPKVYTAGAVGCTLSHFFIYKKIVEEKIPVACILEDDIRLADDVAGVLDAIEKKIKKDEIILLYYQCPVPIELVEPLSTPVYDKYRLYPFVTPKRIASTGGYCITYEVAKRLTENLIPLTTYADDWYKFYQKNCYNSLKAVYPFAVDSAYLPSEITPYRGKYKKIGAVLNLINHKKIFPFYQLLQWKRKQAYARVRVCKMVNKMPDYEA